VVHSLFKEYHSCARSFSLLLPLLAFSLSRLARTRRKKLLKPLLTPPLRMPLTPWAMLLPLLRMLPVTPLRPPRMPPLPVAKPLATLPLPLPVPLLMPLLPLRKPPSKSRIIALQGSGVRASARAPFLLIAPFTWRRRLRIKPGFIASGAEMPLDQACAGSGVRPSC